ncbi:MAG: TolC family protein, partial [Candidatus Sericytochromatia bacterium]
SGRVKEAYLRLLSEDEALLIARGESESARVALNQAQARYRAGEVARLEVLRSEVEFGRSEREAASALAHRDQARARLNVLVGREADAGVAVTANGVAPAALPPLEGLIERAMDSRSDLRRAGLAIEREVAQRRLAQAGVWTGTEVAVLAGAVGGRPGFTTSLTLPIPLYRQQGEIAEAEANRARAEAEREALRREVTLEVGEAYREVAEAARAARAYATAYMPQAERLLDNARRRSQVGEGSAAEVAEAGRALKAARAEQRQATLAHRLALAALERAAGVDLLGL